MTNGPLEVLFSKFRRHGDVNALGDVFDRTAPELGRIAGYLAGGDRQGAEDLLQTTWLTAIAQAARWDEQRPLLPWLLGVLANHAQNQRRAARRLGSHAGAEALGTLLACDDPVRASEDAEFVQLLAAALAELPSPFREAVALHVQHGLTAKEIGEALGRPAGTVRTQIVRGLDRLRELLPRGLAVTGLALLGLSADALARTKANVLAQVTMPTPVLGATSRWTVGLIVAAAVLVGATLLLRTDAPLPPSAAAPLAAPAVEAAALPEESVTARDPVALPAQEPVPDRVVRQRRRIIVHVRHDDEPKVQAGELVGLIEGGEVRFLPTNTAGDVAFDDVVSDFVHQVFVSGTAAHESLMPERLPPPDTFDREVTLQVERAAALVVRVVDTGGHAIAGAEIEGNGSQYASRRWCPLGFTDERGELRLRDQTDRGAQLRARASGHAPSPWRQASSDAEGVQRCELRLTAPAVTLHGRVVDERGEGIAAELGTVAFGAGLEEPWYERTDAAGRFTFDWLPIGHVAIVARVRGDDRVRYGMLRVDVPVTGEVELRLVRGATVSGAVRSATGDAIGGEMLRCRMLADGIFQLPFCSFDDRTPADGTFRYEGLLPGRWLLTAEVSAASITETLELRDGQTAHWWPAAPVAREYRVRLLDERGAPLDGWHVQPCDAKGQARESAWPTADGGLTMPGANWRWPADEPLGLMVFDALGYDAHGPTFPVLVVPGIVLDSGTIDVTVPDRCRTNRRVRGLVVDADGQPVAGAVHFASPRVWWDAKRMAVDGDGTFALGPLPPGRVRVWIVADGLPDRRLGDIDVPFDADLELGTIHLSRGGLVRAECAGIAPADLRLSLLPDGAGEGIALRRDGNSFAGDAVPNGRYTLRGASGTEFVLPQTIVVGGAEQRVTFRCERAPALQLLVELRADERAQVGWSGTVTVLDAASQVVLQRECNGRFRGRVPSPLSLSFAVPPGRYTVLIDRVWETTWRTTCEVTEAGGTVTFRP